MYQYKMKLSSTNGATGYCERFGERADSRGEREVSGGSGKGFKVRIKKRVPPGLEYVLAS